MANREDVEKWIRELTTIQPDEPLVAEACYTLSELGLLPDDVTSISSKQMMLCWRVVEKIRETGFPEHLRM